MCACMIVSKNAYYHWLKDKDSVLAETPKEYLKKRIKAIFEASREIYGSHRIQKKLEREELAYCRSYIGNRDFDSLQIGEKWISDITYIRVNDNWNYLTTIIDLADRKVVSWTLSEDMTAQSTIVKAWYLARNKRQIKAGFIFHSDRGVQYASNKITNLFSFNNKITQSMSRKGNCWDNAVAESFFKTIKHEWLYRFKFTSYNQLYKSIEDYIDWYNTERLHSSLGYLTPLEMELKLKGIFNKAA
jgi:putative transposase